MAYSAAILARAKARLAAAHEQNAQDDAARGDILYAAVNLAVWYAQVNGNAVSAQSLHGGVGIHRAAACGDYGV